MRPLIHPSRADLSLPEVLYALSDPLRLRIVQTLAAGEERACGTFDLPLAKATISYHFKVLREAGVIAMRRAGAQHLSSLRTVDLDARFPGLLAAVLGASATTISDNGRDAPAERPPHPPSPDFVTAGV